MPIAAASAGGKDAARSAYAAVAVTSGDVRTLEHGNSSVVGNHISNFSRIVRTYTPAVSFHGVGLYVANNTIEHGPHNRPPAEPGPQHAGLDAMAQFDAQAEWDNGCVRTATIRHHVVV